MRLAKSVVGRESELVESTLFLYECEDLLPNDSEVNFLPLRRSPNRDILRNLYDKFQTRKQLNEDRKQSRLVFGVQVFSADRARFKEQLRR